MKKDTARDLVVKNNLKPEDIELTVEEYLNKYDEKALIKFARLFKAIVLKGDVTDWWDGD